MNPNQPSQHRTGDSILLAALSDESDRERYEQAWQQFTDEYLPRVQDWALRRGLSSADAEEVAADVMFRLVSALKQHRLSPDRATGLSSWLKSAARFASSDLMRQRSRTKELLDRVAITESELEQQWHELFDAEIIELAAARVRSEVSPRDWKIFDRLRKSTDPPSQIAAEFGTTVNAIRQARWRVAICMGRVVEELESLVPASRAEERIPEGQADIADEILEILSGIRKAESHWKIAGTRMLATGESLDRMHAAAQQFLDRIGNLV